MFTFKKHAKTGRYSSFQSDFFDIKLKKKTCGRICGRHGSYGFMMMIIKNDKFDDGNPNCKWMNFSIAPEKFNDVQSAKDWINANVENWLKENNLELYFHED